MLIDKGYYDYDYEKPNERTVAAMTEAKSDAELAERLRRMGFVIKKRGEPKPLSPEEAQRKAMEEAQDKNTKGKTATWLTI